MDDKKSLSDETLVAKSKYHRGRRVVEKWLFGMYDTTRRIGILRGCLGTGMSEIDNMLFFEK